MGVSALGTPEAGAQLKLLTIDNGPFSLFRHQNDDCEAGNSSRNPTTTLVGNPYRSGVSGDGHDIFLAVGLKHVAANQAAGGAGRVCVF